MTLLRIDFLCFSNKKKDSLIEILYHMKLLNELEEHIFLTINDACTALANKNSSENNFRLFENYLNLIY
jgi:hypothetical protein